MVLKLFNIVATAKYKYLYRLVKDEIINGCVNKSLFTTFL